MASISVDHDQFSCPVCLDLLKDPVSLPCGHSFCMVCINGCWDQEDQRGVYSCPQCRETFTPRPVLRRNNMLAEVVEKLKETELRAAPPAPRYAGPGDVECDFCTGRKLRAIKSCLTCLVSFCETHLKPHCEVPGLKKHKLVKASSQLQEKICSQHDKLIEIYCRTDQSCICYLCTMEEHKGHDTVPAVTERTEKQNQLKEIQSKFQQRIQEKQKKQQELKQAVKTLKRCAQSAVEDSERIFTELIRSIEKKRSEVAELIRAQEEAELSGAEELLEKLEQEIADLKRRHTELEQLSHTEDHIHFLQSFQSLCVSSGSEDSPSITVHQHLSFDGVRRSLSELKERLEEFCREEFSKIPPHAVAVQILSYFCQLTLDPNTAYRLLILSEKNRVVTYSDKAQSYSDHPERFDCWYQVLCEESCPVHLTASPFVLTPLLNIGSVTGVGEESSKERGSSMKKGRKMASISVDHDQFSCPVCLDLLKDPVSLPCGHSFCMVCINGCWDQEDQRGVYSCPQCRETFTPRPVLRRNNVMAEVVEKLKKTELRAAPPAPRYAGPGDVECDFCTGTKLKAIKSCLTCLASFCETHLKPHYEVPTWRKHKLVKASSQLQEKICSQHDEVIKIYCRTDQSCICYLCTMEEHKGHDTVPAVTERTKKQNQLKEIQSKFQQRIQEKQKKQQELKQAVKTLKRCAQSAVEDSERIFTELIRSIEKKHSEVTELIRAQEEAELSGAEELLEKLEQEIADLKRRHTELEQLSHTEDHIHFLQSFQSLCVSSGSEDSPSITVHQHLSFDGVRRSLSELKERLEEFCREEFSKIPPHAAAVQILSSEPKTRQDFLQYFCQLTLDPNTAHRRLILSEKNRVVTLNDKAQSYSDHPERFERWEQVLCKESVSGRCYWEVEWSRRGTVYISVSYKGIRRKGWGIDCGFGHNSQSWSLQCSSSLTFRHNNIETKISGPSSSRIGVYVDHSAGTLSFYSVSDTMTLLHTVHTTFTQPLYAGFCVYGDGSSVRLCDK
ncbi:E3 ubiquitin/ISG15 ligase TRIM25-like [Colossoma macropomum]|uniref:E3 ubiquitin/ISG15 ligase TRIM25-like n=1 Tax=Colossoma macropomum TaxID=42526 RepID=UPI001863DE41|nr:E3 ubiquitin/ISG15 ligase TRIM25-like [Colossoma macropomum]